MHYRKYSISLLYFHWFHRPDFPLIQPEYQSLFRLSFQSRTSDHQNISAHSYQIHCLLLINQVHILFLQILKRIHLHYFHTNSISVNLNFDIDLYIHLNQLNSVRWEPHFPHHYKPHKNYHSAAWISIFDSDFLFFHCPTLLSFHHS